MFSPILPFAFALLRILLYLPRRRLPGFVVAYHSDHLGHSSSSHRHAAQYALHPILVPSFCLTHEVFYLVDAHVFVWHLEDGRLSVVCFEGCQLIWKFRGIYQMQGFPRLQIRTVPSVTLHSDKKVHPLIVPHINWYLVFAFPDSDFDIFLHYWEPGSRG